MSYREQDKASDKGLIAEIQFELEAIKRGISVCKPLHPKSPYDYIIDLKGGMERVQIKYTSCTNPSGNFKVTCAKGSTSKYSKRQQYYEYDCDFIVALTANGDWYMIPMSEAPTTCITLTKKYDKYKNDWGFNDNFS